MKLCYQVATPDVAIAESVTAYQGSLAKSFGDLAALGYDGVELMTLDPGKLNWDEVRDTASQLDLCVGLVCTGEVFGQLGLSFADPDAGVRTEAVERVKGIIDFAAHLDAKVNIGRVRGQYRPGVAKEQTEEWAIEAFRAISDHAAPKKVDIALETVTIMQTNFINTMAEGVAMVDKVNRPNFRMMMDVFHLNIEEKDMYEAIRKYSPYNIHVHLSDNNRRYPGNCGMDFERVIKLFHECGYDGAFCTEIFQQPSMEEAAKGAIEYLAPIFERVYGRKPRA
ncbi:MAG: sugar phosphate isomerase/epimerase [Angelakisella sp.]|nr:sugar phosphate isomerase/epimerase [Angelakisella sp.]